MRICFETNIVKQFSRYALTGIEPSRGRCQPLSISTPPMPVTALPRVSTPPGEAAALAIALLCLVAMTASAALAAAPIDAPTPSPSGASVQTPRESDRLNPASTPPNRGATRLREPAGPGGPDAGHSLQPASPARDTLPARAQAAFAAGRPLVVMFSLRGCPWCDALRREHFAALMAAQERLGVFAIEIDLTDPRPFNPAPDSGRTQSVRADNPRELGQLHRVRLAPTVLFLGPDGEVAERLVGYGSPDFFGAYLEQRITQARAALKSPTR